MRRWTDAERQEAEWRVLRARSMRYRLDHRKYPSFDQETLWIKDIERMTQDELAKEIYGMPYKA